METTDFSKWFCLKERLNFTIDPQINESDARYYFGRDEVKERLHRQIRHAFIAPGVPKMMISGPYGSGKTQTLFYLQHFLKEETPSSAKGTPHTAYFAAEMRSNSTASHLHMQLMETLGKDTVANWVRKLFDKSPDLDVSLARLTEDPNIRIALKELRGVGDTAFASWRWLTGQPLKGTELNNLQLTRNLGELGASDLVSALVATGNLADHVNEKLIFLIDEMEELQNVRTGDAADSIHQYFRRLAEPANSTVGFIVGFKADVPDEAPLMLRKEDVRGRIGPSNYVDLRSLSVIPDVKAFVGELLKNLTDETRTTARVSGQKLSSSFGIFPFSESALDLLAAHATGDPTKAFPRYIINTINECAIQAWDEKKALIDDSIVNIVAGYAFG